jgi:nucleotide-binding universal stress UspA family protein
MDSDYKRLPARKVLLAIDDSIASPTSHRALAYARDLATVGGEILAVRVGAGPKSPVPATTLDSHGPPVTRNPWMNDTSEAVDQAREFCAELNIVLHATIIDLTERGGHIAHALAETAQTWEADLVVAGARPEHRQRGWIEHTVAELICKLAQCPLLVVPASFDRNAEFACKRILFAVDGSDAALFALRYGARLAMADAHLHAIYVVDRAVHLTDFVPVHLLAEGFLAKGSAALAQAQTILSGTPSKTSTALVTTERTADDVAHTLVREALRWNAGLLTMGTRARRGVAHWLPSHDVIRVARLTQTPLLLIGTNQN